MTKEEELKVLLKNIEVAITIYNKRAKELEDYSRTAYIICDYNREIEHLKSYDIKIEDDWEPDYDKIYDFSYGPKSPEAWGWFPSSFCP